MNVKKKRQRIRSYVKTYYSSLRDQMQHYAEAGDIFPDFLVGPKRVLALAGQDGTVVGHYPDNQDSFDFRTAQRPIQFIVRDISGPFVVNFTGEISLSVASVKLVKGSDIDSGEVVWQSPWHKLEIVSTRLEDWSNTKAAEQATRDVHTFVASHLMKLKGQDPTVVLERIKGIIDGFEELLHTNPDEAACQDYLEANPVLLSQTALRVTPKVELGSEYVTDFVIEEALQQYTMVEIESPRHKLFTRRGDPTKHVTHALRQTEDWRSWVHDNVAYARQALPGITDPECLVVIGRSVDLTEREKMALQRKNLELSRIKIVTYDELVNTALRHVENLRRL